MFQLAISYVHLLLIACQVLATSHVPEWDGSTDADPPTALPTAPATTSMVELKDATSAPTGLPTASPKSPLTASPTALPKAPPTALPTAHPTTPTTAYTTEAPKLAPTPVRYVLTSRMFAETDDHVSACRSEFGTLASVADWTDLATLGATKVDIIMDDLAIPTTFNEKSYFVTHEQQKVWGDKSVVHHGEAVVKKETRVFFFERHGGKPPNDWLVHDTLGDITLGSWHGKRGQVLCAQAILTSCCTTEVIEFAQSNIFAKGDFSIAIGDAVGPCCVIDAGLSSSHAIPIASASKLVTGYIILRLIDKGLLNLDDRVADILDWWTDDPNDKRSRVTVRQLLSQTDGMGQFNVFGSLDVLNACSAWDTIGCAKQGYRNFRSSPGEKFLYSETSFYVLGAIAMQVTGHGVYDSVFREIIANPFKLASSHSKEGGCWFNLGSFSGESLTKTDPGGGLSCTVDDYAKFLRAVYARDLVSAELHMEAERPQTINATNMPYNLSRFSGGEYSHYALGSWRECPNAECSDSDGIKIHSMGMWGFYPWIWRNGNESHWGILARTDGMRSSFEIMEGFLPLVRSAVQGFSRRTGDLNNSSFLHFYHNLKENVNLLSGAFRLSKRAGAAALLVLSSALWAI